MSIIKSLKTFSVNIKIEIILLRKTLAVLIIVVLDRPERIIVELILKSIIESLIENLVKNLVKLISIKNESSYR